MNQAPGADLPRSGRGRLARFAGIAAVPALIGAFLGAGGLDLIVPQDPYEKATEEAGQRMMDLPGFEARFGDVDEDEAFEAGAEIGIAAIPRLSDSELEDWLAIVRQLIGAVEDEACAMVARGSGEADEWLDAFRTLDLDTYRRYIDLLIGGVELELADAPGPSAPSQAEVDAALGQLLQHIGADRLNEIGTTLANPTAATDAAVCAAMRDFYDAVAKLDPEARATLIRTIIEVAGSA
jgi:hypothetical protein